jgi:hypothetical protein
MHVRLVNDRDILGIYYSADGATWQRLDTRTDVAGKGEARLRIFQVQGFAVVVGSETRGFSLGRHSTASGGGGSS